MKLIRNSGNDRVIDHLREWLTAESAVDFMTPTFSVQALAETREFLDKADRCRLLLGDPNALPGALFGGPADISYTETGFKAGGSPVSQPIGSISVAQFAMHHRHCRNRSCLLMVPTQKHYLAPVRLYRRIGHHA